jgi:uncharacterized protein
MAERLKANAYNIVFASRYFRRTYTGAELDLVDEKDGQLHGYEFKGGSKKAKAPSSWTDNYQNSTFGYINAGNYLKWLRESAILLKQTIPVRKK